MNALSGFPRSCLPDYDNNLMLIVLSGELATWVLQPFANKGQRKTHQFIEFTHLRIYWQLFSSLEYFVILIRMRQASERIFFAILPGHQELRCEKE